MVDAVQSSMEGYIFEVFQVWHHFIYSISHSFYAVFAYIKKNKDKKKMKNLQRVYQILCFMLRFFSQLCPAVRR